MFAVIKTGGKQYRVSKDDVIAVEKLTGESGDVISFTDVLMLAGEGDPQLGAPLVDGVTVTGEVVEQTRGAKILVFKKKRRKNYRRTQGHRQHITLVRITDIFTGDEKPPATQKAKAPTKAVSAKKPSPAVKAEKSIPAGKDDLKKISGLGPVMEKKLGSLGINTFAQISIFNSEDIKRIDGELNLKGKIEREDWVAQAKKLAED